jgi:hypothetical protein
MRWEFAHVGSLEAHPWADQGGLWVGGQLRLSCRSCGPREPHAASWADGACSAVDSAPDVR